MAFFALIGREVRLAWRQGNSSAMAVTFFLVAVTLFPLGIGPELSVLARISAGVIWVAALLSALLTLDRLFQQDFEDGSLDLLALAPMPMELIVLAKSIAHWLTTGLPLVVAAPLLAVLLNMDSGGLGILMLSLAIGTPALSLTGAIGAALTVTVRRGGVLMPLLILPLYVPTLIFGVGAVDAVLNNIVAGPNLLYLGALSLVALALAPFAAAAAIRLALE
ncbi:MAG: heme exporter protein CcmB [Proteobacteria bacterium]|nr:heme exporter protein CcmB [Pseudomonadota bacterium]